MEQQALAEKVARRKEEYDTYQSKYGELKQQSFTKASYTKLLQEMDELQAKNVFLQDAYLANKEAKKRLEQKLEELAKYAKELDDALHKATQQQEECQQLGEKYRQYVQHLAMQKECMEQLRQLEEQKLAVDKQIGALQDCSIKFVGKLNDLQHELKLPVWDDNANVYHLKIKDFVEKLTQQGMEQLHRKVDFLLRNDCNKKQDLRCRSAT